MKENMGKDCIVIENHDKVILSQRWIELSQLIVTKDVLNTKIITQTEYTILEKMFENNYKEHFMDLILYLICNPVI